MSINRQNDKITLLYERLSHEDGEDGISNSIQNQQYILENYAKNNDFTSFRYIFDDGKSGTTFLRQGWEELMCEVEAGNVSTINLKTMDRMGCDYLCVGLYLEKFKALGIRKGNGKSVAQTLIDTIGYADNHEKSNGYEYGNHMDVTTSLRRMSLLWRNNSTSNTPGADATRAILSHTICAYRSSPVKSNRQRRLKSGIRLPKSSRTGDTLSSAMSIRINSISIAIAYSRR
jgi:hypothetical protein